MSKRHHFTASVIGIVAGMGIASAAMAEMSTYQCQFTQGPEAQLTFDYDTGTGQFALIDFNGAANLPANAQVRSFTPAGAALAFTLNYFEGDALVKGEEFSFDLGTGIAQFNLRRYGADGAITGGVGQEGACTVIAGQAPPVAEPAPVQEAPVAVASTPPAASGQTFTYGCQINQIEGQLSFRYEEATGQFAIVDHFGTPNLPEGAQITDFYASSSYGGSIDFTVELYNAGVIAQSDVYSFHSDSGYLGLERHAFDQNGAHAGIVYRSGECAVTGVTGEASTGVGSAALPVFSGEGVHPDVLAALILSEGNLAVSQPAADIPAPSNTICTKQSTWDSFYADNSENYIDATWCASTAFDSTDLEYGGILGFITETTDYGGKPSWCTALGGHGNFGQGESIELSFWLPVDPNGIRALVIRSGTGYPADSPYKHSKPRVLRVEADGQSWTWNLESNTDFQAITFDQAIQSEWVRVVIEEAYMGETWSNTCIRDLFAVFDE